LAAEIREKFPAAEIIMIPSGKGRFEISRDGIPVFEKSRAKRHAEPGEIVELLRKTAK
jgi:predicted Rdx family selenoprotein